jgi:hypothetical protein
MKKYFLKWMIFSAIMLTFSLAGSAQVYIHIRPTAPRVVVHRPPPPGRDFIWVNEEWAPRGGAYEFAGGRWIRPPYPGAVWIPGHWKRHFRDWVWIPGHWRRR